MFLGTLVSDLAKAGSAVKNFIEKVAGDAPAVVQTVTNDANKIIPVLEAFVPKSTTAINLGFTLLDKVAQAVEDAGTAAASNGLSVQLDQSIVADIQAVIAAAKSAAGKGTATAASAPVAAVKH